MERLIEPPRPEDVPDSKLEPEIHLEKDFSKVIAVDNIPQVPADKADKLEKVLLRVFSSISDVKRIHLPKSKSGETKGYCFIEFYSSDVAENAIERTNGYSLDKNHKFVVNSFADLDDYMKVPDTYTPIEVKPYEEKENLRYWLSDDRGMDQYAVLYDTVTEVLWNDLRPNENPISEMKREKWSKSFISWSPLGSYLATIHKRGVPLWGGQSWKAIMRFDFFPGKDEKEIPESFNVLKLDFSPNEKYLITLSTEAEKVKDKKELKFNNSVHVWDVRTGKEIRKFPSVGDIQNQWPIFKWSSDDKYVARMSSHSIAVYESATMELLDKKTIKIENLKEFSWSPSDPFLSYTVVPDNKDKPTSVTIIEIPSKKEKLSKNIFSVKETKLYWQSSGDYLAVQFEKETKTKKASTGFQILRLREKGIPAEQIEIHDATVSFAWEPKGHRFALIHGEMPRPNISFYSVEGSQTKLLKTLEKKPANGLYWSPQGNFIVFAGLHNANGALEFYNANDLESLGTTEHFMCTSVQWDPTGRYVTTHVSWAIHQLETGYNVYSFSGKLLRKVLKDHFFEFYWRPRPPSLLPSEKLKEIKKNIHKYSQKYKKEDETRIEAERKKRDTKRQQLKDSFFNTLALLDQEYAKQRQERHKIPGYLSDDEGEYEDREEWVEKEVAEETTIIG